MPILHKRLNSFLLIIMLFFTISCSHHLINSDKTLSEKQQIDKENLLILAKKESSLGNLEDARKYYLKAIKIDPNCDVCYYEMANIYYRANYLINAVNLSKQAYDLDTTNSWYQRQYANFAMLGGNYTDAKNLFIKLIDKNQNSRELYYSLASVYENTREFDNALALYDTTQIRFGFNPDVALRKQEIYNALGRYNESLEEALELIDADPEDPRFYTILGDSYAQMMNDSLAINAYNKAIEIDSTFPPAVLGKAEIARKSGNFEEYFENLRFYCQSDVVDDKNKVEYLSLVLSLPSFSEFFKPEVEGLFAILNQKYPQSKEVKLLYSSFLMQTSQVEASINVLEGMLKNDSTDYNTWNQLLSICYSLMDWDNLAGESSRAIPLFPDRPYFYMYRGVAYWQLKELDKAAHDFETALTKGNKDEMFTAQVYAFLGDLYHEMGKEKKSFESYEESLKIDTLNATVLNNYAYYLSLKNKNMQQAYQMSKRAIEIEPSNPSFLDTFGWILFLQGKLTEARAIFRQALASGGRDSAVVLDHYADVLHALGEYDTASIYWNQALEKPDVENREKILQKLQNLTKK